MPASSTRWPPVSAPTPLPKSTAATGFIRNRQLPQLADQARQAPAAILARGILEPSPDVTR